MAAASGHEFEIAGRRQVVDQPNSAGGVRAAVRDVEGVGQDSAAGDGAVRLPVILEDREIRPRLNRWRDHERVVERVAVDIGVAGDRRR